MRPKSEFLKKFQKNDLKTKAKIDPIFVLNGTWHKLGTGIYYMVDIADVFRIPSESHNLKVVGSNPTPATKLSSKNSRLGNHLTGCCLKKRLIKASLAPPQYPCH
jgi:hypothetical protein